MPFLVSPSCLLGFNDNFVLFLLSSRTASLVCFECIKCIESSWYSIFYFLVFLFSTTHYLSILWWSIFVNAAIWCLFYFCFLLCLEREMLFLVFPSVLCDFWFSFQLRIFFQSDNRVIFCVVFFLIKFKNWLNHLKEILLWLLNSSFSRICNRRAYFINKVYLVLYSNNFKSSFRNKFHKYYCYSWRRLMSLSRRV